MDESEQDHVEFIEAREDTAEALESPEQAFDLVTFAVECPVVLPGFENGSAGARHHGQEAEVQN